VGETHQKLPNRQKEKKGVFTGDDKDRQGRAIQSVSGMNAQSANKRAGIAIASRKRNGKRTMERKSNRNRNREQEQRMT
jgi:hypothetical protein